MEISKHELLAMYVTMVRIRLFEERMRDAYFSGITPGTIHLYIGQEAVAVGICQNLRMTDQVVSTHRGHGHCIAKRVELRKIAAEILGKATGCCQGRGGTMHLSDPPSGFLYSSSIVGGGVPLAVGAGLSMKRAGNNSVVACFFGDGATNTGGFHEGLNLASVWKLPVIFVCENNLYALSVCVKNSTCVKDIAQRAAAYSMPGVTVDGNDVSATYAAAKTAIERARKGEGPTLIECKTYRWLGHFAGDIEQPYRTKQEVEEWKKRDPIKRLEDRLIETRALSKNNARDIREQALKDVEDAFEYAVKSPYPPPEDLRKFIF